MTTTNFDFVQGTRFSDYYDRLGRAEEDYLNEDYSDLASNIRVVAESVVASDLEQSHLPSDRTFFDNLELARTSGMYGGGVGQQLLDRFHQIRKIGNQAVHTVAGLTSKTDALRMLHDIFDILRVELYARTKDSSLRSMAFREPARLALQESLNAAVEHKNLYRTSDRKIIYVAEVDQQKRFDPVHSGYLKIGDTSVDNYEEDFKKNSPYLRSIAEKRVREYMTTAGLPSKIDWTELAYSPKLGRWFRDYDVHKVLKHSNVKTMILDNRQSGSGDDTGREWFRTDVATAKEAITAVKEGRGSVQTSEQQPTGIVLRPEQKDAIRKTIKVFDGIDQRIRHSKTGGKNLTEQDRTMLWYAKMRFGKTLTALNLVKQEQYRHVIILTHRPVVNVGWYEDFTKSGLSDAGYCYGSRNVTATYGGYGSLVDLQKDSDKFIYFASLQDLTGSKIAGGKVSDKNRDVFGTDWDLVIVDEAHEGTQTQLAENVLQNLISSETKILQLSGTPFNLLTSSEYDPDHIFTWDYVMEQQAKKDFAEKHPGEDNPYAPLPKMSMYTFELGETFTQDAYRMDGLASHSFNFAEFFRVDDDGKFVHEKDVDSFLTLISSPDEKTNYPFSTREFRDSLRHTLWILPSRAAANALEDRLHHNPVFGVDYHIVNVVRDDSSDNVEEASEDDLQKVRRGITNEPWNAHSITLTVRKLTTGVTVPEWTGVMFLSNTSSAMQYLQAAFRVQSPYSSEEFGEKTNCYVFDFAPDRALTVLAASASISPQRGRATTEEQRDQLGKLLNFLPVLGMRGNRMRPFNVNMLMGKIKQAFAERAVQNGFDDDSIYSDAFMKLTEEDVKNFQHLRGIIGTEHEQKKELRIDVNDQNLTDEERERADSAQHKNPKERTPEEEAALEKRKKALENRRKCISIIRGISIRIPLMIYGMDMPIGDDITLNEFIDKVDEVSWKEFMPEGVTKDTFRRFAKFYDPDVFISAGRIIRQKVRDLDDVSIYDRAVGIADIFHSFRNPDKETVLTPWNVVNLHLSRTLGGWCHFEEGFSREFEGTERILRRTKTDYTDEVFRPQTRILEINSKTGLYPLYMSVSLYEDRLAERARIDSDHIPSLEWQQETWRQILRDNIFVVAKTPMARHIAQRTLRGFHSDWGTNIVYIKNLIEDTRTDAFAEARTIESEFSNVKFDVVIGNPPYQQPARGESTRQEPVYHLFYQLAYNLADVVTLISPARFLFDAGQTPKKWNEEMLDNPHVKVVLYEADGQKIFPGTDIKGGVVITLMDKNQDFGAIKMFTPHKELAHALQKVEASGDRPLSQIVSSRATYRFAPVFFEDYRNAKQKVGKGTANMIVPKAFELFPEVFLTSMPRGQEDEYLTFLGLNRGSRETRYVERRYVLDNDFVASWNVLVPKSNGSGAFGEILSTPVIAPPQTGSTDTFISIGSFASKQEAANLLAFIKTKFARAFLDILKVTQDNPRAMWRLVPLQDFTDSSDINWNVSIPEIDNQLYQKYGLDQKEINFIEQNVQAMK